MKNLEEMIKDIFGSGITVANRMPVSGGDINRAYRLELSDGAVIFMKANAPERESLFNSEAAGLEAIRKTGCVRVPKVLGYGADDTESYLLLEYIEPGRRSVKSSAELGEALANMHLADAGEFVSDGKYGFIHDNYIGSGTQINTPADSWIEFFINCRLMPQFERVSGYFDSEDKKTINRFIEKLDRYLVEPDRPSLLHGDLWAGNYMIDSKDRPWLIDPATYVGHSEVDIAMTELFGGFDDYFYDAYTDVMGLDPGYRDRRDIYNLHSLLNHLNLFGGGYFYSVKSIIERYAC